MAPKLESRELPLAEIRVAREEDEVRLEGYAVRWMSPSVDLGSFQEQFKRGAFRASLKDPKSDVRFLANHDPQSIMARTTNDTLTLKEDAEGLAFSALLNDTSDSRDTIVRVERGDVSDMSFRFLTVIDEWKQRKDEVPMRTVKEAVLEDVSVATFPAYPDTSVALRSLEAAQAEWTPPDSGAHTRRAKMRLRLAGEAE